MVNEELTASDALHQPCTNDRVPSHVAAAQTVLTSLERPHPRTVVSGHPPHLTETAGLPATSRLKRTRHAGPIAARQPALRLDSPVILRSSWNSASEMTPFSGRRRSRWNWRIASRVRSPSTP